MQRLLAWLCVTIALLFVAADIARGDSCASNADCHCGWNASSSACAVGTQPLDEDNEQCRELCHGSGVSLDVVCRHAECERTARNGCLGDCDADANVTVDEVVSGINIALGTASLAACRAFDTTQDGTVTVDEISGGLVAVLQGCAAATRLPAALGETEFFDASMAFDNGGSIEALATRSISGGHTYLSIDIGPNEMVHVEITPGSNGQLDLAGYGVYTDIGYVVQGTAASSGGPGGDRIEGELQPSGSYAPFQSASFVVERNTNSAARFSGRYRFDFSNSPGAPGGPSSWTTVIDVAQSGVAFTSGGSDVRDGIVVGTVTSGSCLMAGGGSLTCDAVYLVQGSEVSARLRMTGRLMDTAEGIAGNGRYLVGIDPPYGIYVYGGWSATAPAAP